MATDVNSGLVAVQRWSLGSSRPWLQYTVGVLVAVHHWSQHSSHGFVATDRASDVKRLDQPLVSTLRAFLAGGSRTLLTQLGCSRPAIEVFVAVDPWSQHSNTCVAWLQYTVRGLIAVHHWSQHSSHEFVVTDKSFGHETT